MDGDSFSLSGWGKAYFFPLATSSLKLHTDLMHYTIRVLMASALSSLVGYICVSLGDWSYSLFSGGHSPQGLDTFTIINYSLSTIISGIVFIIAYIKITNWLES
jgi:hypothetical protein